MDAAAAVIISSTKTDGASFRGCWWVQLCRVMLRVGCFCPFWVTEIYEMVVFFGVVTSVKCSNLAQMMAYGTDFKLIFVVDSSKLFQIIILKRKLYHIPQ